VKWLVSLSLDVHLKMVQKAAAMLGDTEKMHPGAIAAPGSPRGLAVHGDGP
jgi:hypothetical protein